MKKSSACFPRLLRVLGAGMAAALVFGAESPAQAQFFFPFFDNRPSTPPRSVYRPNVNHRGRVLEEHPRSRPHREKSEKTRKGEEKRGKRGESRNKPGLAAKPPAPPPSVVEAPPPAYEPQLLRLSEIMGSLAYLQTICAEQGPPTPVNAPSGTTAEDAPWRDRMENLMTAEDAGPARREKLAGAYNRGWQGYQYSYRMCTPNAQFARRRFLDEGARLAHAVSTRYRAN
jgi:predicted secreted protein